MHPHQTLNLLEPWFPAPRIVKTKFLLFLSPPVCDVSVITTKTDKGSEPRRGTRPMKSESLRWFWEPVSPDDGTNFTRRCSGAARVENHCSRVVLLRVWYLEQQPWHLPGSWLEMPFLNPIRCAPSELWGWDPGIYVLISPPGDSEAS